MDHIQIKVGTAPVSAPCKLSSVPVLRGRLIPGLGQAGGVALSGLGAGLACPGLVLQEPGPGGRGQGPPQQHPLHWLQTQVTGKCHLQIVTSTLFSLQIL